MQCQTDFLRLHRRTRLVRIQSYDCIRLVLGPCAHVHIIGRRDAFITAVHVLTAFAAGCPGIPAGRSSEGIDGPARGMLRFDCVCTAPVRKRASAMAILLLTVGDKSWLFL